MTASQGRAGTKRALSASHRLAAILEPRLASPCPEPDATVEHPAGRRTSPAGGQATEPDGLTRRAP